AVSGVGDGEHDVWSWRYVGVFGGVVRVELDGLHLDRQATAERHRVSRVDHEVHDHLFHLARIDLHLRGGGLYEAKLDVLADHAAQQVLHAADDRAQI